MKGCLQAKGKNYYAVISDKGKKKWVNLHISSNKGNKRKAEQAMNQIVNEYYNNRDLFNKIDFVEFARKWLKYISKHVDEVTYIGYAQYTEKHIIPFYQQTNIKIQDMTIKDVESYYNHKFVSGRLDGKPGGLSIRTIKLHSVAMSQIFEYAIYNGLIKENPCKYAKFPKEANNTSRETSFYDVNQCNELLSKTKGTPLYNMIYITFLYGLRRSEMMGLKWDAINFDNDTLTIKHTVVLNTKVVQKDKTKNRSSNRTYPLLPEIKKILIGLQEQQNSNKEEMKSWYKESGYVFTKADGTVYYPSYPTHELSKVLKKNNLPHIRWHDLRHSTASFLIEKGWHMKDISDWLGHSSIKTTMDIYGHISTERKKELSMDLIGLLNIDKNN